MNWLTNFVKPKLSALVGSRKTVPDNLWQNCPNCGNMMHHKDLYDNLNVCNSCEYHFRISVDRRIETLFGKDNFNEVDYLAIKDSIKKQLLTGKKNQVYNNWLRAEKDKINIIDLRYKIF